MLLSRVKARKMILKRSLAPRHFVSVPGVYDDSASGAAETRCSNIRTKVKLPDS